MFFSRTHGRRRSSTSTIRRTSSQTPTGVLQPEETYSPHSGTIRDHSKITLNHLCLILPPSCCIFQLLSHFSSFLHQNLAKTYCSGWRIPSIQIPKSVCLKSSLHAMKAFWTTFNANLCIWSSDIDIRNPTWSLSLKTNNQGT